MRAISSRSSLVRGAALLAALLLPVACTTLSRGSSGGAHSRDLLLSTEIPLQLQATTALEMLRLVRPEFLANRTRSQRLTAPTEPVVYVNGLRMAELAMLRHVTTPSLVAVHYVRGVNAIARYGLDHEGGALLVTTRGH